MKSKIGIMETQVPQGVLLDILLRLFGKKAPDWVAAVAQTPMPRLAWSCVDIPQWEIFGTGTRSQTPTDVTIAIPPVFSLSKRPLAQPPTLAKTVERVLMELARLCSLAHVRTSTLARSVVLLLHHPHQHLDLSHPGKQPSWLLQKRLVDQLYGTMLRPTDLRAGVVVDNWPFLVVQQGQRAWAQLQAMVML